MYSTIVGRASSWAACFAVDVTTPPPGGARIFVADTPRRCDDEAHRTHDQHPPSRASPSPEGLTRPPSNEMSPLCSGGLRASLFPGSCFPLSPRHFASAGRLDLSRPRFDERCLQQRVDSPEFRFFAVCACSRLHWIAPN
ncbi:hypothetical protein BC834DRAFT_862840 [Gloeopeniophorella convolvens]|nr:hypothetical protein BC834DRAFT_862840 [Gloeopeniophorella convolvens]